MSEPSPSTAPDWATQAIDSLESVIGAVKAKTSDPLVKFGRTAVYALLASGLLIAVLVLSTIGLLHLLTGYLRQQAWAVDLIIGGIFLLAGMFCWSKRKPRAA